MKRTSLLLASVALSVLLVGGVALAAEISCPNGNENLCVGTAEDDTLVGTNLQDEMRGLAGNDTLVGKRLRDTVQGNGGNDIVRGEGGRDFLYGDDYDYFSAVGDNDRLVGGPQNDDITGGPGNDRMSGGPGDDLLDGRVSGSATNRTNYDYVHGNDGDDTIHGDEGELYGEAGADHVFSRGDSVLYGGPGNDVTSARACEANTVADATGGPGEDYLKSDPTSCDSQSALGTVILRAVDGEHDKINCYEAANEIVRADRQDTFYEYEPLKIGREYCDDLTIVE